MTEPTVLDLILRGQERVEKKIDTNTSTVASLEARVDTWERQQSGAQSVHDRCRDEVDQAFRDNHVEHVAMQSRIGNLESDKAVGKGTRKGVALVWKILAAVIGTAYTVMLIADYFAAH